MAQKVIVELEDDLDGGPADETVRFGFDGTGYEIDLSTKNAKALRDRFAPYIEHGRRAAGARRSRAPRSATSRAHSNDIRAWAREQGIQVSERGRIPVAVAAQYEAAH